MTGTLVAAASGIGFGLFQTLNIRAVRGMDPFASTFLQIFVAAVALGAAAAAAGGIDDLADAPAWALADFAGAGVLHFIAGWTCLNLSQKRIGAARTGPLLITVPLFGMVIAAVTVGQLPAAVELPAIALMVLGAYVVASRGAGGRPARVADALPALGCSFCWALSPVLTLRGLEGFDDPLLGLALGLAVSVVGYLVAFAVWRPVLNWRAIGRHTLGVKIAAGLLVGLSTWGRWAALEDTAVAVVLALNLLSVPVVLLGAPLTAGRHAEHVTARVWLGAALIVSGSLLLIVLA
ncbi:MAG TPA: DMT family transporter [Solirubrobacteraceae bacterium]|nr:DMT family transporter [Solirubrobacteraceae bacterium]